MATVSDVLDALEVLAPKRYAFGFDKVGLQVGDPARTVRKGLVSLDRSLAAVEEAISTGCEMLVAHHPLLFEPAATVTTNDHVGQTILKLAENKVAFAAAHTNWDSARGGINDALAAKLQLVDVQAFGFAAPVPMLKLVVFAPIDSEQAIREAASKAGAGTIGNYSQCAFSSEGVGTFLGNEHSSPVVGTRGTLQQAPEVRIEMQVRASLRNQVEQAVRQTHPYEEPAYDFFVLADNHEQPAGRIGILPTPLPFAAWASTVESQLNTKVWAWGDADRLIRTVAIVGGGADGEWKDAQAAGADAYLTGEVRQHVALEAVESGMPIIAAGHYATEHPGCEELASRLKAAMPSVEWSCFTPAPGIAGRPLN